MLVASEYDREQEQAGLLHSANQVRHNSASFSLSLRMKFGRTIRQQEDFFTMD